MTLLEILVLGAYGFTAGAYVFTWRVYRLVSNHWREKFTQLETRLSRLEDKPGSL